MTVAAVLLVKDEADMIETTLRHLAEHVDEILVDDNQSTDGTYDIIESLLDDLPIALDRDPEVGYYQARKMTRLAQEALDRGHRWVIPCDADEVWYATDGRPIREFVAGLAPDVLIARAPLYDHIPTILDDKSEANPVRRIQWKFRQHGALPKVACRLDRSLQIGMGNHDARYAYPTPGVSGGLAVRHFTWRTAAQYAKKIRNGAVAYAATSLPEEVGLHWRMHGDPADDGFDERVEAHFYRWFHVGPTGESTDPRTDDRLELAPAPLRGS